MCGIVGMVSKTDTGFWLPQQQLFNQLLVCDSLRGADSTGVFGATKEGNADFLKIAKNPFEMLLSEEYQEFMANIYTDYKFVVGHNRKATIGKISDETAHPFQVDNIILVHNGTLTTHANLTKQAVEVDSHAITHAIAERGYKEAIKSINGAYALVWYDAKDKALRIVRNDKRPLAMVELDTAWIFASELPMIEWLLARDNTKIKAVHNIAVGTVYTFNIEDSKNYTSELLIEEKPVVTTPVVYKAPKQQSLGRKWASDTFQEGQVITVNISTMHTYKTPVEFNAKQYHGYLRGTWIADSAVPIIVYCEEYEMEFYRESGNTIYDTVVRRITETDGTVTGIWTVGLDDYMPEYDISGNEVFKDEFNITDKKCKSCGGVVNWNFIQLSRFKYKTPNKFRLVCHVCCDKSTNRAC